MDTQGPQLTETNTNTTPIICDTTALTPEERTRTLEIQKLLRAEVLEEKILPDGYAFRYKNCPDAFQKITEFVNYKLKSSPYLECKLIVERDCASLWLQLTGRGNMRDVIHADFSF
jgi:hypothetical protein